MPEFVYLLCAATSFICFGLLWRSFRQNRSRLLLWSALCFAGLTLNNVLLFVDLVLIPTGADLSVPRTITSMVSLLVLLFGLIWEAK